MAQEVVFDDSIKSVFEFTLDNGKSLSIRIDYIAILQGFYLVYCTYNGRTQYINLRITLNMYGILSQFGNVLPFDFLCYASDGIEPVWLDSFTSGRVKLLLVSKSERKEILLNLLGDEYKI